MDLALRKAGKMALGSAFAATTWIAGQQADEVELGEDDDLAELDLEITALRDLGEWLKEEGGIAARGGVGGAGDRDQGLANLGNVCRKTLDVGCDGPAIGQGGRMEGARRRRRRGRGLRGRRGCVDKQELALLRRQLFIKNIVIIGDIGEAVRHGVALRVHTMQGSRRRRDTWLAPGGATSTKDEGR